MDTFIQELRLAARRVGRSPGFAVAAVLTLALAIGANTAVFSVIDRVLLRPLDVPEPERLVVVWETPPRLPVPVMYASPPRLHAWQERARSFAATGPPLRGRPRRVAPGRPAQAIGGYAWQSFTIGGQNPEQVPGARVTAGLLEALGVQPRLGRLFLAEEDSANAPPVAILSDALWRRRFGADPHILGRSVPIGGVPTEIVGVMPPGFDGPPPLALEGKPPIERAQVWVPHATDLAAGQSGAHYLVVLARLRPGVSVEAADREMDGIQAALEREHPDHREWRASVVPLVDEVLASTRAAVTLLGAAVGFMLLLACANIANLLLARGVRQQRELGIRAALGASRGRLAGQVVCESLVLALLGCAAGIPLALVLVRMIVTYGPPTIPGLTKATIDLRVLGFAVLASVVAAVLTSVVPAVRAMRSRVSTRLIEPGTATRGTGGLRVQQALAVGQVAIAVAVLVAAALLVESFRQLVGVDPGFRPQAVVTAKTFLPDTRYDSDAAREAFMDRLLREARALPGVSAAGVSDGIPLADRRQGTSIWRADRPEPGEPVHATVAWVSDGYFESLSMPLLAGRTFAASDVADAAPVLVLNRRLAQRLFGDEAPIGRAVEIGSYSGVGFEVVGVVGDDRHIGIATEPTSTFFVSARQRPDFREMAVLARAEGSPESVLASLRGVVRRLDPQLPFFDTRTMSEIVSVSLATPRSLTWLLTGFALSGLLLAALGLFGVLSHAVSQRRQEIGVRLALGATPQQVLRMVVGQGLAQVGAGLVIGFALATALSQLLGSLLFGVTPFRPVTYIVVAGILTLVGVAACLVPARRAARVDPMIALRTE